MPSGEHTVIPVEEKEITARKVLARRELFLSILFKVAEVVPSLLVGPVAGNAQMPLTHWTLILTARDLHAPDAQAALARLCEMYWYPLYAFVRRQGHDHHQAQDFTQGFFEHLLSMNWLGGVGKEKGRFRSFLLCAISNHISNERSKQSAFKRGGGKANFVSWDAAAAEARLEKELLFERDPAVEFDRLWACALAEKTLANLRDEYIRCGKQELFRSLSPYLTRTVPPGKYAEAAVTLRMTEGALRIAMHRLVQSFAELLRREVAHTVRDPAEVDEELRDMLKCWVAT